jgi:hypothetical protein
MIKIANLLSKHILTSANVHHFNKYSAKPICGRHASFFTQNVSQLISRNYSYILKLIYQNIFAIFWPRIFT